MINLFQSVVLIIFLLILTALAAPSAVARKSWWKFLGMMILSFFAVVLPLLFFGLSSFLLPEWKGACVFGWLDCFIIGKLALTPLVLWATGALYSLEILRVEKRTSRWIVIGIFLGAIIASACFLFGLACIGLTMWAPLLVPFYVAAWYSIRAFQLIRAAGFHFRTYFFALLGSLPFWLVGGWWSRAVYESLPDKAPSGCFIVTAASRGHGQCVGPLVEIIHKGLPFKANHQLITFWHFESCWRDKSPFSHTVFRVIYNRAGPILAARIKTAWQADLVYLALKPAEWLASICLRGNQSRRIKLR